MLFRFVGWWQPSAMTMQPASSTLYGMEGFDLAVELVETYTIQKVTGE